MAQGLDDLVRPSVNPNAAGMAVPSVDAVPA